MQINNEQLKMLKEVIRTYEEKHGVIGEVQTISNNCTDCYSDGGCKNTCRNTCKSTCGFYGSRY